MAVQPQTPYIEHIANGTTTGFNLGFDCDDQDHLIVLVDDAEPAVGSWSLVGGAVVFGAAPTSGNKITIQRNTPFERKRDYQSYDNSFRPPVVNKDFDWIWLKLQELGVADWILGSRISLLKDYVDQQDVNFDQLAQLREADLRGYLESLINNLEGVEPFLPIATQFVAEGDLNQQQINTAFRVKNNERVSPFDYGASGDGVTNDTTNFKEIEATETKTQIDLVGGAFALTSSFTDPVNGVTLTKDYVNGTLIIDGKKRIFDKNQNFAMSAASFNRLGQPSSTKSLGLKRITENEYQVWRPLGGQYWQQAILRRTANNVPLNWQDTYIKQVLGYICSEDGNTYSGTWATLDSNTGVSSASDTTYIGGRARQSQTIGDYVDITYVGGGDLYVVFVGRSSGNYVNVLLDGAKEYLTLPADGADNRYFDTYTPTDLQFKQLVRIASGVPNGTHTIRLTLSASKNPASTGNRFMFNALAFDSAEFGPWRSQADAKAWKTAEVILLNQVRRHGSNYYYASVAGTTGLNPPTHTNGAVSDGGVTWTYRALSGYDLVDTAIQVAGSQLEYAYEIKPDGATASEDVGAALHGNETQTALKIAVNGNAVSMLNNTWLSGDFINIVESQYSTHSQISGGATPIFETVLTRTFKRQWFEIHHKHTVKYKTECGYFYPHMWPLLHYHGVNGQKYVVDSLWSSGDGYRYAKDYYSQLNPIVGRTKDTLQVAYGQCLQPNGSGGVPSTQKSPLRFAAWLSVDPESVNSYSNANSVFSGKAMNISGANTVNGGYSSDVIKMYFERYAKSKPKLLNIGDTFECFARYGLDIYSNS